jgi:hypothetical protein
MGFPGGLGWVLTAGHTANGQKNPRGVRGFCQKLRFWHRAELDSVRVVLPAVADADLGVPG